MLIRPYQPSDFDACLQVFRSNGTDFFAEQEEALFSRWLYKVIDLEEAYYYVVEEEGVLLGCGGFYLNKEEKKATLAWGMVTKERHQQGFGEQLLRYRIEQIQTHLPEGRIISMDTSQMTAPFFQKLGFKVTRIQKDYYATGLDRYDMELRLAELKM